MVLIQCILMKVRWLIFGLSLMIGHDAFGLTNLFTNNGGDESWSNTANWSLGVIPDATHDVTVAIGVLLRIPNGTNAVARSVTLSGNVEMIITIDATLEIVEYIHIYSGAELTNRGNVTLLAGCEGIDISTGGILLNNDTIYIHSPDIGIDFRSGTITNNELISIEGTNQYGVFMPQAASFPNQRQFINNAGATISIINPDGVGIWLSDTITNTGNIVISNIDRDLPNVPAEGIYIVSFGKLFNSGYINISDSEDHCLRNNAGVFKNEATSIIDITGFQDKGFVNESIADNYGELNIDCTILTAGNRGIHLINGMTNRTGGQVNITGNDNLEIAIEVDNTFTNEAGADIQIGAYLTVGIQMDDGGFNNYGTVNIGDVVDLLGYGIEAYSYFNNYGMMTFENMGSGIRNVTDYFNNYGSLIFHNLLSKAIFSEGKLTNHDAANILIYNDDGSRISWGITHIDELPNQQFTNDGSIYMDSVNVGLDLRIGDFINNGLLFINHYRYGIDFGTFYDPAVFTNNGDVQIQNQQEPLAYTIYLEGGDPNTFNFFNNDTATFEILNAYRGFQVASGMKNTGIIRMTNITEKAFYLNNSTNAFDFLNNTSGAITIDNAQYGVYLGSGGVANKISFTNQGSVTFKSMGDYGITGENTIEKFENDGAVIGNAAFNCNYVVVKHDFYPGSSIGAMSFDNYVSASPTYHIQMKGNAGAGNPNGHDIILVTTSIALTCHLEVTTLSGFAPMLDDQYTILLATGTITGTFLTVSLPDIGPNLMFEIVYLSDRVKLKVVPKYVQWTGAIGTSWNNANNWSNLAVPDENTFVEIPGGAPHYPLLNASTLSVGSNTGSFKCRRLEVGSGGQITLVNVAVDVHDDIDIYGLFSSFTSAGHQVHVYNDGSLTVYPGGNCNLEQL